MPRIEKSKTDDNVKEFDIKLEKGVSIHVHLDNEIDAWLKDIRHQLIIWRNIPVPEQINQYDESVKKLCRRYDVDPRKIKGQKARQVVSHVIGFVRRCAIETNNQLVSALVSLKFLKQAFYLDEIAGQYKLRSDIAALFDKDEIDEAIERYFKNQPVEHGPEFPTYQDSVPAEYLFPLMDLLTLNFNIELQIEDAIKEFDIEVDTEVEDGNETVDDAGFHPPGLDDILDD